MSERDREKANGVNARETDKHKDKERDGEGAIDLTKEARLDERRSGFFFLKSVSVISSWWSRYE